MKKTGVAARFSFGASISVLFHVASGIEITASVVSRIVQVLHVRFVSTKGIGGGGTLGNGSAVVVVVVVRDVVVDWLASHGSTTDDESGRSGQNKQSHD
jgi:hypothetical protein